MEFSDAFAPLGISEIMLDALRAKGFTEPTPIQLLTVPALLTGSRDLIAQAQTGTGKTAAYGIPIIEALDRPFGAGAKPRALVLTPTRELAMQVAGELATLNGARRLRHIAIYGGQPVELQLQKLRAGVDVVIGTPGRVIDLMERGALKFDALEFAVLDEADEMLDMGFVEDIETILGTTAENKRMLMFSATMPDPIKRIATRFMHDPELVSTQPKRLDDANLTEQIAYEVRREDKLAALERIIAASDDLYAMVFCRTRSDVDELVLKLQGRGLAAEALHGELAQSQRTRIISRFKAKLFKILIATDVAARGIDVNDLTHVINYSIPQSPDIYIHRIGRTGRAGKRGTAITLTTPGEYRILQRIKREAKTAIDMRPLPDAEAIVAAKKATFNQVLTAGVAAGSSDYLDYARELLHRIPDAETLVATLLEMRFGTELLPESYANLSASDRAQTPRNLVKLHIGLGRTDGYGASRLLDLIYNETRVWKCKIGKIDCREHFSLVELPEDSASLVLRHFENSKIHVALARPEPAGETAAAPAGAVRNAEHPREKRKFNPAFRSRANAKRPPRS